MIDPLPSKPLPRYLQISEMLSREILAGHWRIGERIPTEVELSASLGVAIGTLRKAVAELEQRGVLVRKQGSGTYVRTGKRGKNIYEFFRLELKQGGGLPSAEIIGLDIETPPEGVVFPGSATAQKAYRIRRARLLNGMPIAAEEIWIDLRHKKNLQARELSESLYLHYKDHFGFWISRVEDHISIDRLPAWACGPLSLPVDTPCTFIERHASSNANLVEEYSKTWVNPKLAQYSARW